MRDGGGGSSGGVGAGGGSPDTRSLGNLARAKGRRVPGRQGELRLQVEVLGAIERVTKRV